MREWLSIQPSNEVDPVALMEARQAENSRDRLNLTWIERMDLVLQAHMVPGPRSRCQRFTKRAKTTDREICRIERVRTVE